MQNNPIILFDGVCNYCNFMVNFAIKNDKKALLKFAPLQSEIGKKLRQQYQISPQIDSLIFIYNGNAKVYADAALSICYFLNYPAKLLVAFKVFPLFISNPIYKFIAKNRYKWFGKTETCMIPTQQVKNRFL